MLYLYINPVIKNYALNTRVLCKETYVVINSPLESFTTLSNGYLFLLMVILFLMVLSFFKYKTYIFLGKLMLFFIEKPGMILTIDTLSNIILSFFTKTSNLLYNFIVKKLLQGRFNVILPGVGLAVDPVEPINPAQAADPAVVINPGEIPAAVLQDFPGAVNLQGAINPAEVPGQLPSPANSDHDSEWSDASSNDGDGLNLQELGYGVVDDEYFSDGSASCSNVGDFFSNNFNVCMQELLTQANFRRTMQELLDLPGFNPGFNQQNFEIAEAFHGEALPLIPVAIANILPVNNLGQALAAVPLPVAEVSAVANVLPDAQLCMAMAHEASVRNSFMDGYRIYQENRVLENVDGVVISNLRLKLELISKTAYNIKKQPPMAEHNMEVVNEIINFVITDPIVPMVAKTVEQLASITL
jgi:hypothetical protein